jgi:hypothetical protein
MGSWHFEKSHFSTYAVFYGRVSFPSEKESWNLEQSRFPIHLVTRSGEFRERKG